MARSLAAGTQRSRPADRGRDRIAARIDRSRDAQRHLRTVTRMGCSLLKTSNELWFRIFRGTRRGTTARERN